MYQQHTAPNGVQYYTFQQFENCQVRALFTTRHGGVSTGYYQSLNFGFPSGDSPDLVRENYNRLAQCLGTDLAHLVTSAQTHTSNVRIVTREDAGKGTIKEKDFQDIDGLITQERGIGIITAHADCTPVQFYDPVQKVIGVAHSGWMGTLKNISHNMVSKMNSAFGCCPEDILVGIGPALCQNCFEVDFDVAEKFALASPDYLPFIRYEEKKAYIRLKGIIETQLKKDGILPSHIEISDLCTKCRTDLFYSHRAMGVQRGVMASAMLLP